MTYFNLQNWNALIIFLLVLPQDKADEITFNIK